jgi:hypothetical protein
VLSNDWVIRYDTRYFQVARQSHQAPAKSTVLVRENAAGAIEIRYRERLMRWTEIAAPSPTTPAAPRATGSARPKPPCRRGQAADHPWRHVVETHGVYRQLAKDRRAWERIQP